MTRIAILGGGLSGKLAALYLARHLPEASLTMIDPGARDLPVVGESTVEVTCQFLYSLGLGAYLEENHLHKYGLTYYFRLPDQADPNAPQYIRHESPGVKRLNAFNLNRHAFDEELERRLPPHLTRITGKAETVEFASAMDTMDVGTMRGGSTQGPQIVKVTTAEGDMLDIPADHVIDCSGRARLLTKQLELAKTPPFQRCAYWFRLAGFDRDILMRMPQVKDAQNSFDSYYVTHHFYGKGYWIWIIPMKSGTGEDMVSIGITYRPDVSGEKAMNMDRLIEVLRRDHPRLAELVLSGRKVDESRYYNYMYEASQYYDRNGRWFLLGDSGFTFDPANSAGIAYLSVQIPQITSMIRKSRAGQLSTGYVDALEGHVMAQLALQDDWSRWYEYMDDPIKMAWTLKVLQLGYFSFSMPTYMTGYFLNAGAARQASRVLRRFDADADRKVYPFDKILDHLADTTDPQEIIRRAPSLYGKVLPFNYFRPEDIRRGRLMGRYLYKVAWLRNHTLKLLKWWKDPALYPLAAGQYARSTVQMLGAALLMLRPQLWDRSLSKSPDLVSAFEPAESFLRPPETVDGPMPRMAAKAEPDETSEPDFHPTMA